MDLRPFQQPGTAVPVVDVIDCLEEFRALKSDWLALERRDPHSSVFLSWAWLAAAFAGNPGRWRVVIVYCGSRLLCALPLKYRVHWSRSSREFQSQIEAGGRLLWSEYTGFLCDPDDQGQALALAAVKLRTMPWAQLSLRYEESPDRAQDFLSAFPVDRYDAGLREYRINKGQTDNLVCPRVALPGDFDHYLDGLRSRSHRQKLRRAMRQIGVGGDLRVSVSGADGFDEDV